MKRCKRRRFPSQSTLVPLATSYWSNFCLKTFAMFKKDHDLSQRSKSHMKNKEVRKLKKDIFESIQNLSETQVGEMLVEKGNVTITKLASKTLVYSMENIPYFFDIAARNDYCPTVFALWRAPQILRSIVIHPSVSGYLLKGADLMIPGIVNVQGKPCVMPHIYLTSRLWCV